jgi:hypothetical protein
MAFDRAAARAAGYSDEEINAYLQSQPAAQRNTGPVAPGQEDSVTEPPAPTTQVTPAGEGSIMPGLATAALGAAQLVGPAAAAAALGYGVSKYGGRAVDAARNLMSGAGAARAMPPNAMVTPGPASTPAPSATATRIPITTTPPAPAASPIIDAQGRPIMRAPVTPAPAPGPMPTGISAGPRPFMPPQSPGIMQQGMDLAAKMREIAAQKVMQNAGTIAKGGAGLAAALTPGNIGQRYNFPTTGPYAGMEINPMTGRPWTPQELQQLR